MEGKKEKLCEVEGRLTATLFYVQNAGFEIKEVTRR